MATTVHIDDLTQDQALSWLIANDSEYDWANNQDAAADEEAGKHRKACIHIEWEE